MKQRLTSVITARQKSPINFVNARRIVVVLCIILIFALPAAGSANQSLSDLSAQALLYETMVPTGTTTHTVTPTATQTITPSLTATEAPTITASLTATEKATTTASPTVTTTPLPLTGRPQILVSRINMLYVYTQTGELLESYEIPYPIEPTEYARDIIPGPNKTIFVYNGTANPYLSILNRDTGTWTHTTYSGWSTTIYYPSGGIGRFSKYIYLTDMFTGYADESGILRYNIRDESFERHALGNNWRNLTIGLDNLVYAHDAFYRHLYVLDPITMQIVHEFEYYTPGYIWSIAVNAGGEIFGVSTNGMIYKLDNNGLLTNSVEIGAELLDIDISEKGQFVVSGRTGEIILLDENLVIQNQFSVGGDVYQIFVAFLPAQ